jgi:hypothetical protein
LLIYHRKSKKLKINLPSGKSCDILAFLSTKLEFIMKWIIFLAVLILAPTFVTNLFSSGVTFVSTQGKALVAEVVKEGAKTVQEAAK